MLEKIIHSRPSETLGDIQVNSTSQGGIVMDIYSGADYPMTIHMTPDRARSLAQRLIDAANRKTATPTNDFDPLGR